MKKEDIKRIIITDIILVCGVAAYMITGVLLFGGACPTQLLFDFPCPFCGMTRAHIAAFRLDFEAAFSYHPLFFLGIPYIALLFHEELFKGKWKTAWNVTVIVLTVLFIIVYLCRILHNYIDF